MIAIEVAPLEKKHKDDIVEVLFRSFEDYPLMQFFFGDAYQDSARYYWKYVYDFALIIDGILLGAFTEGELQGFAFIIPPQEPQKDFQSVITHLKKQLIAIIGEKIVMRIDAYLSFQDKNKPPQPHFYLDVISVDPQSQGKGLSKALLSQVHAISEQHPHSRGVALETQTEQNIAYYKRFGYGVYRITELDDVKTWFMFRHD